MTAAQADNLRTAKSRGVGPRALVQRDIKKSKKKAKSNFITKT